jgi:hypothetical protein
MAVKMKICVCQLMFAFISVRTHRLEDHIVSISVAKDTVSMLLIKVCTHHPVYIVS